jgi:predicted phage tail protein
LPLPHVVALQLNGVDEVQPVIVIDPVPQWSVQKSDGREQSIGSQVLLSESQLSPGSQAVLQLKGIGATHPSRVIVPVPQRVVQNPDGSVQFTGWQVPLCESQVFPLSQVVALQLNGVGVVQPGRVIEPVPQWSAQKPDGKLQSIVSQVWLTASQVLPASQVVVLQLNEVGEVQPGRVIEPVPQWVAQ